MQLHDKVLFDEMDKLMHMKHSNNFIVDIGASFNSHFLKYNCKGLLFDMDFNKLMQIPPDNLYEKINRKITPDNVISVLEEFHTPLNFLALNLDIDSYDLFVLINLLKKYSPEIIISELNEKIPMPINFSVTYRKDWGWKGDHFYGYSLNCLEPVLKHFNYTIHTVAYNNVILTKGKNTNDLTAAFEKGYENAAERKNIFYWNNNVDHWHSLEKKNAENEIRNYFRKYDNFVIGEECKTLITEYLDN